VYKARFFGANLGGGRLSKVQCGAIGVLLAGLFLFWNWPKQGMIQVIEATYGESCKDVTPPLPALNMFKRGNATDTVKQVCAGKTTCAFPINVNRIGDPVAGCAKDFRIIYSCRSDPTATSQTAPPEAHGRTIMISCDRRGTK
jgi:hypothetical protein